jgi:hypothetical protein
MAFAGYYNKYAHFALGGAAVLVAAGAPISVGEITISNNTGAGILVTITDNVGTPVTVYELAIAANDSFTSEVPKLFDKGLRFAIGAATTFVTVWYRDGV